MDPNAAHGRRRGWWFFGFGFAFLAASGVMKATKLEWLLFGNDPKYLLVLAGIACLGYGLYLDYKHSRPR
jgi:hypothetical protein